MTLPFVTIALQQEKGDCAIASLAMLLGKPYVEVLSAAVQAGAPHAHRTGMSADQLIHTAAVLHRPLTLKRAWDLDNDEGLLTVEKLKRNKKEFAQHLVLLKFGLVFDTDGIVYEPDFYFEQFGYRPVSIFVEEGA